MGKMPLVGVLGAICLGLNLTGCESCGCGKKGNYQASSGNLRSLASGSNSTSTTSPTAAAPAQPRQWNDAPKMASTPPASSGSQVMPASGYDATPPAMPKDAALPLTPAPTSMTPPPMPAGKMSSATDWQSKPMTPSMPIQQTSATMPSADAVQQTAKMPPPLDTAPAPKSTWTAPKEMPEISNAGGRMLPPLPPTSKLPSTTDTMPSATTSPMPPPPPAPVSVVNDPKDTLLPLPVIPGTPPSK